MKNIAKNIALSSSMGDGVIGYSDAGTYKGKQLTIGRDRNNVIYHIGYKLFDNAIKAEQPMAIYDFIERYLLELDCIHFEFPLERRLKDDKFLVMGGSLKNVSKITPATPCSVTCQDNKFYEVIWTQGNTDLLHVAFPIQYELLLGMPKVEIEKKMKEQISGSLAGIYQSVQDTDVAEIASNIYQTRPVANYYVESLNTARYYTKKADGRLEPIYDSSQKWYSATNLLQGVIKEIAGYKLYIEQNIYGFNKECYTVTLQQWLDYCRNNDITVYFAIEEERADGLKGLLIGQSKKLGFNHMMSIIIPDNFITNPNTVLKATLNAYIPTQNVKELYQQYVKKPKKKI